MNEDESLRLRALELAVELRKSDRDITGKPTIATARVFESYIKTGATP